VFSSVISWAKSSHQTKVKVVITGGKSIQTMGKSVHLLDTLYPGKRKLSMLSLRRSCPLSLINNIVYSWVVYRARVGAGATAAEIARNTRLQRSKTVAKSVRKLLELKLICTNGRRYHAEQPPEDWFVYSKREGPWYTRLVYWRMLMRTQTNPLTATHAALLSMLYAKQLRDGMTVTAGVKQLASLLHVTAKTVRTGLKRLEEVGFIKDGSLIPPQEIPEYDGCWWREAPPQKRSSQAPVELTQLSAHAGNLAELMDNHGYKMDKVLDGIGSKASQSGYDPDKFIKLLIHAMNAFKGATMWDKRAYVLWDMGELIRAADGETAVNRKKGKVDYPNSFGLFRWKLERRVRKSGGSW
jgi:predicted transcriptional regulator